MYKPKENTDKFDCINLGKVTMQMSFWKGNQGGKAPLLPIKKSEGKGQRTGTRVPGFPISGNPGELCQRDHIEIPNTAAAALVVERKAAR